MPTSFRIDKDAGVVYRTITGEMTTEQLIEIYTSMLDHPDFRPGMSALTDMRGTRASAYRHDVLRIAEFVREHHEKIGHLRIAVVVSSSASYGMMRELEAELEESPIEIGLFRDLPAADEWLGIPVEG
jgi:hypothetical protein